MSDFTQEDSILQETTNTYRHMIQEMTHRIIKSLMSALHEMLIAYSDLRLEGSKELEGLLFNF